MDPISLLSETLRSAIVKDLQLVDDNLQHSADRIVDFFSEDLDLLAGMNRKRTDWAIDMLIKPSFGPLLDIPKAIHSLAGSSMFYQSSPRFVEDYRWYKSPGIFVDNLSSLSTESYWTKCHNFLDVRETAGSREQSENKELFEICEELYSVAFEVPWTKTSHELLEGQCMTLQNRIDTILPHTSTSLKSFLSYWRSGNTIDLKEFRPWWGRRSQYVSTVKR